MSSATPSPIGSVIADRYEVLDSLGSGQHGEVWRVHDRNLNAEYALKLLEANQIGGPWAEAHLLNSLSGDFEAPQVSRRILVSWKDANHAEEDRSEGQGAVCAAGVGALAGVPVADRCC